MLQIIHKNCYSLLLGCYKEKRNVTKSHPQNSHNYFLLINKAGIYVQFRHSVRLVAVARNDTIGHLTKNGPLNRIL